MRTLRRIAGVHCARHGAALMSAAIPRLRLSGISRRYGDIRANDGIDLSILPGEIHALLGENGSGKSTLSRIICGISRPDAGGIEWDGRSVSFSNAAAARTLGIGMVFQHFALFESLTVAENIALALPRAGSDGLAARIEAVSRRYGLPLDPRQQVAMLSAGERQRVEIVRCLLGEPRLLVLDEPTSVLSPDAIQALFDTLRRLAAEGVSILFISHKLDEVRALCHRATVLRAGRVTGEADPRHTDSATLVRMMLGEDPAPCLLTPREPGTPMLELQGFSLAADDPFGTTLSDIDLAVHAGEILGLAGISGNGQRELVAALSGERRGSGSLRIAGLECTQLPVRGRRALGFALVPEERLGRGAVPAMSLADNMLLTGTRHGLASAGFIHGNAARERASAVISQWGVRGGGPSALASQLSGGNLQKFIVGREVGLAPRVLVVAQPTWGVDAGAAQQIRQRLIDLRDAGCALLVISEDMDELFQVSDRIAVINGGRISTPQPAAAASLQQLGQLMASGAFAHA
jgi:general nucleoside transport system ATP-binding protein